MERYIIALNELGLRNDVLLKIILDYNPDVLVSLFDQNNSNIFLTNMELLTYKDVLSDYSKLSEALNKADEILKINQELGVYTAIYSSDNYPCNLMRINNPPAIIYYKGANPNIGFDKAIASIGTRRPTQFGFNAINYLIPQWVNEGFAIISGLAYGIDRLSHIACLTSKGKTIAVLAHGLDRVYPKENVILADAILKNGGTLLSEYPVKTRAEKYRFINRNRLIVGLSKAIVAMECEEKSGSMHSIEFAKEQKCPIFCPDPGLSSQESLSGLKYILENNIGTAIKDGRDYECTIIKAGYDVNESRLSNDYIKNQYLRSILIGFDDNMLLKKSLEEMGMNYCSDFINLDILYSHIKSYILEQNIKITDVINLFIKNIISTTDEGKIELDV
ncbi:DNA protecting protein DprA [Lacrimispora xylanisolvens]|uniref:DNA protecting protein DprA n=1 Tax=Lacrimispora xylanisolvens TaxID=384636 RepID=A0A2S6HJ54_9FIRM|nr:DNA-processing protein DprA [Hungatella xylanolytica]PPK77505.1 DNA protecting protein DprA [Hungatella xylanolytica]